MRKNRWGIAAAFAAFAVMFGACGAATASPTEVTREAGASATSRPEEPLAPQTVVSTIDPATPAAEPTQTPAPLESPRVLWLRTSHAGPGVVTLRFETNVATAATVKVMTNQVGPAAFYTEELEDLVTSHVTSVPANAFGRYQVRVQDSLGNVAWAELRYLKDTQGIDWATGANAPVLKALSAKKLQVDYAFPAGHPTKLGFDGAIRVFSSAATCTTADSCPGDPVGDPVAADAAGDAQLESHAATLDIPGSAFNYQVIIGQPLNANSSTMVFMQLEIRGDQLPKVNFQGPGNIKN
jgi:hypothetical protein